jgi:hypothetical protein
VPEGVNEERAIEVTITSLAAGLGNEKTGVAGGAVDCARGGIGFVIGAERV